VRKTLGDIGQPHHYHAGHLTPLGLFDMLEEHPNDVIVLDDVSRLLKDDVTLQLFLAALGQQPNDQHGRIVRYRRQGRDREVEFTGGIIFMSNLVLHPAPLLEALRSRVHHLRYEPSEEEMAALMRHIAGGGWHFGRGVLSPDECREVTEYLIAECQRLGARLDLRVLIDKAYPDYLQWRAGHADIDWRDLITTTIHERLVALRHTQDGVRVGREARLEEDRRIAREIDAAYATPRERAVAWERRTGRPRRAFYRRLADGDE
jgi:hypothetical protein